MSEMLDTLHLYFEFPTVRYAFIVGLLSLLIAVSGWSTLQYVPDFFNDVFTAFVHR